MCESGAQVAQSTIASLLDPIPDARNRRLATFPSIVYFIDSYLMQFWVYRILHQRASDVGVGCASGTANSWPSFMILTLDMPRLLEGQRLYLPSNLKIDELFISEEYPRDLGI
jgi:hypothetical protein